MNWLARRWDKESDKHSLWYLGRFVSELDSERASELLEERPVDEDSEADFVCPFGRKLDEVEWQLVDEPVDAIVVVWVLVVIEEEIATAVVVVNELKVLSSVTGTLDNEIKYTERWKRNRK